jgi:predicted RNase H-like HicB family nuclease
MKIKVHVMERESSVQAFCPDLPGCSAAATSEEEALSLLRERVTAYFMEDALLVDPGTRVMELEV